MDITLKDKESLKVAASAFVCSLFNDAVVKDIEPIQDLWSQYGVILRVHLEKFMHPASVIVKVITHSRPDQHPRGWSTKLSHQRKIKSYQVEKNFYENYSSRCSPECRIANLFGVEDTKDHTLIVLEDLKQSGFHSLEGEAGKRHPIIEEQFDACLKWLANFHSNFLRHASGAASPGPEQCNERLNNLSTKLWQKGTYWHLDTRPDELAKMNHKTLKRKAREIDRVLDSCQWMSLVHGDAKVANFCFNKSDLSAAALDFQYVGGGCGMKDLAYFVSSCLDSSACKAQEESILKSYFDHLYLAMRQNQTHNHSEVFASLEEEWRRMYPFAWADFSRFLEGWNSSHWKLHDYANEMVREAIDRIEKGDQK